MIVWFGKKNKNDFRYLLLKVNMLLNLSGLIFQTN
jgi:hypothetical protein